MKTYIGCYPCFLNQALMAMHFAGADEEQQFTIMHRVLVALTEFDATVTPPEVGDRIHRIIREETQTQDPYKESKRISTQQALDFYPELKKLVKESIAPLDTAIRLAIAGNVIDFAVDHEHDLEQAIDQVLSQPPTINDIEAFQAALREADNLLYLADNAGETVFDRVLIETLDVPVTYVVKGGPSLNDATYEDAVAAGLDKIAEIIDNGLDSIGTILDRCSPEFQKRFAEAPVIISKGQSNYESVPSESRVFYLLKAKCPIIGQDIGVPQGSIVMKQGG
ncbi:MAG: DUF89 family protein [Anaerolineae bacterium]|nr:DUF89 family protein [Anaerolineae bacterium]